MVIPHDEPQKGITMSHRISIKESQNYPILFILLFFTQAETPHMLKFVLLYTVTFPGPVQETVGELDSNPGQLRPLSGVAQLP
jgi:hypothetical protein